MRKFLLFLAVLPLLSCSSGSAATPVDAATSDACTPIVHVDSEAPLSLQPVPIVTPKNAAQFKVEHLSTTCIEAANLHFAWYFDWDAAETVLDTTSVCQDLPTCTIVICDRPKNARAHHTLLMVVSDAKLLPSAVSPTDFPAGTAFDAILWQLDVEGPCL